MTCIRTTVRKNYQRISLKCHPKSKVRPKNKSLEMIKIHQGKVEKGKLGVVLPYIVLSTNINLRWLNSTLNSKKKEEANDLLLKLHNFNINKHDIDESNIQKFYILWLMNWFSDGIIRKQKEALYRRFNFDFPKEMFILNY